MATGTEAYVDTSALIAFADRSDSYHARFRSLFAAPPALITTAFVVAEGHGWFLRRYDRLRGLQFLSMVEAMHPMRILPVGADEIQAGTVLLRQLGDQNLTLTDAVGLHVMARQGIRLCWSTDRHLGLTGIPLAIHR